MKKRLALVALVFVIAVVSLLWTTTLRAQATPTVDVNLLVAQGPVANNDTFTVLLSLEPTHIVEVDALQLYLDFDPTVLQIVPASATNDVEPGAPFAAGRFKDVLQNSIDNTAGQIDFAGGAGVNGAGTVGPFVAGAVTFRAIAPATNTTISFGTVIPRETKAVSGFDNVTGALNDLSFTVAATTPLSELFQTLP